MQLEKSPSLTIEFPQSFTQQLDSQPSQNQVYDALLQSQKTQQQQLQKNPIKYDQLIQQSQKSRSEQIFKDTLDIPPSRDSQASINSLIKLFKYDQQNHFSQDKTAGSNGLHSSQLNLLDDLNSQNNSAQAQEIGKELQQLGIIKPVNDTSIQLQDKGTLSDYLENYQKQQKTGGNEINNGDQNAPLPVPKNKQYIKEHQIQPLAITNKVVEKTQNNKQYQDDNLKSGIITQIQPAIIKDKIDPITSEAQENRQENISTSTDTNQNDVDKKKDNKQTQNQVQTKKPEILLKPTVKAKGLFRQGHKTYKIVNTGVNKLKQQENDKQQQPNNVAQAFTQSNIQQNLQPKSSKEIQHQIQPQVKLNSTTALQQNLPILQNKQVQHQGSREQQKNLQQIESSTIKQQQQPIQLQQQQQLSNGVQVEQIQNQDAQVDAIQAPSPQKKRKRQPNGSGNDSFFKRWKNKIPRKDQETWLSSFCNVCEKSSMPILVCMGPCLRAFHPHCIGLTDYPQEAMEGKWFCPECSSGIVRCYACGQFSSGFDDSEFKKCSLSVCGHFYHKRCAYGQKLSQVRDNGSTFRCAQHYCFKCTLSGDGRDMIKCIRCANAFHSSCLPSECRKITAKSKAVVCHIHPQSEQPQYYIHPLKGQIKPESSTIHKLNISPQKPQTKNITEVPQNQRAQAYANTRRSLQKQQEIMQDKQNLDLKNQTQITLADQTKNGEPQVNDQVQYQLELDRKISQELIPQSQEEKLSQNDQIKKKNLEIIQINGRKLSQSVKDAGYEKALQWQQAQADREKKLQQQLESFQKLIQDQQNQIQEYKTQQQEQLGQQQAQQFQIQQLKIQQQEMQITYQQQIIEHQKVQQQYITNQQIMQQQDQLQQFNYTNANDESITQNIEVSVAQDQNSDENHQMHLEGSFVTPSIDNVQETQEPELNKNEIFNVSQTSFGSFFQDFSFQSQDQNYLIGSQDILKEFGLQSQ